MLKEKFSFLNLPETSIRISVLVPVLNEVNHIDELITSLLDEDIIGQCEFLLIDGGSTDGTLEKIEVWKRRYPFIQRIDNPQRFVSFGFNKALKHSIGRYIAFLGAHAEYPSGFLKNGAQYLETNQCDAVGGPLVQKARTPRGQGIALAMSSKLGVGNTEFRTSTAKRFVDSVAFAIYKREIFNQIGLLDEELIRNQDDEFHYRMNASGYKILMVPEMQCVYYVRESLSGLFSQYFNYGLFKPLVLKKVKAGIRLRHLVPTCFVLYLLLILPSIVLLGLYSVTPLILYTALVFFESVANKLSVQSKVAAFLAFPALHVSYGLGFLLGFRKIYK